MEYHIIITLVAIFVCNLLAAFFSAAETAITAVSRARIYHLIIEGDKNALTVGNLRKNKERLIGGIMLANNSVNILASALATELAIRHWGDNGVLYVTFIMTVVVVIFGEVLPKTYAIQNSERTALKIAPFLDWVLKILNPINLGLQFIVRNILRLTGLDNSKNESASSASDVIRGTIELHHHEGRVVKHDRDMLGSILDMQEIEVGEIMAHRVNMETVDIDLPTEQIVNLVINSNHSRIPFWQGDSDNIIGILHVKRLIQYLREHDNIDSLAIRNMMIEPWFIPDTTNINAQLHEFRNRHQYLAIVIDEYGVLQGLVTLEDIIEEIVGRIDDKHDKQIANQIEHQGENTYIVNGSMTIRDLNREQGWDLPDEEASTIAGLVINEARLIPEIGEIFEFYNMRFTIIDKKANQIMKLKIEEIQSDLGDNIDS